MQNDAWVASGATFDAQRQNIIDGLANTVGTEWDLERSNLPVTDVVRTSDTVVTITLSALSGYDIASTETVGYTINLNSVTSGTSYTAIGTFSVLALAAVANLPYVDILKSETVMNAKQSSAITILLGPYITISDGSPATGLSIAAADVRVSKNGSTTVAKNDATAPVHDNGGYYTCELDAIDLSTVGSLKVYANKSGAIAPPTTLQVVHGNVFTGLYDDTEATLLVDSVGRVDVASVAGTAQTAGDLQALITTLDAVADDIKAKTDQMVFTKASELDVNTRSINSATVVGDGNATPWDGA